MFLDLALCVRIVQRPPPADILEASRRCIHSLPDPHAKVLTEKLDQPGWYA